MGVLGRPRSAKYAGEPKNRTTSHTDPPGQSSLLGEYANADGKVEPFIDKIDKDIVHDKRWQRAL